MPSDILSVFYLVENKDISHLDRGNKMYQFGGRSG